MNIEQRLDQLENAHRALAAQHLALLTVCRVMLPLIDANFSLLRELLQTVHDTNTALMDEHGHDHEFQAQVQHWIDVLSSEISAGADKRFRRPNPQ